MAVVAVKQPHGFHGCFRSLRSVAQSVGDQQRTDIPRVGNAPGIAADVFARLGDGHAAPGRNRVRRLAGSGLSRRDARQHGGAQSGPRADIDEMRLPDHRAEAVAGRAGAGIAVFQARRDVAHARALVEREDLDALAFVVLIGADEDFPARTVLEEVGRKFGRDQSELSALSVSPKPVALREVGCCPPCLRDAALIVDADGFHGHFQRAIDTLVPSPGFDSMENSLHSRLAPPRPSPMPLPDRKSILQGQLDVGDARALVLEREPQAAPAALFDNVRAVTSPPPP